MTFADIHIHLLCGADDGAENEEQMRKILDAAYADGTRIICATPHFHPGYFGDNRAAVEAAFEKLKAYAEKYEDLKLYLGNELRYSPNCLDWLQSGECRTINGSRYLLVDFAENADEDYIVTSVLKLLNAGYKPILAHTERYESFHRDLGEIQRLKECGVLIQLDAQSPFGGWGKGAKKRSKKLLEHYLVDLVASDAHDTFERPPQMSECFNYVANKYGADYANSIFLKNPCDIVDDSDIGKEID